MTYTQETVGSAPLPDIDELRSGLRGQVFAEGDDGYAEASRVWNGAHDGARPALIVRCSGAADVIAALGFARAHDLEIAVRGGGHSIAGFSTGDGVAVIDLSALNEVHVDPAARRATVGEAQCGPMSTTRRRRMGSPPLVASCPRPGSPDSRSAAASAG